MSDDDLRKYRDWLVQADHQASLNYDKAVLTLAGGALALSVTFLHDIVPSPVLNSKPWLMSSWIAFLTSLTSILVSYLFSMASLRKTIRQVDDGSIYRSPIGGWQTKATEFLRYLASVSFIVGVLTFVQFIHLNY